MPGPMFSAPNLALVAYAEVHGANGNSTTCNSGVTTTRTALGTYVIVLPTGMFQGQARDVILVQPKGPNGALVPKMAVVDDILSATKTIAIWNGIPSEVEASRVDSDFSVLILRTTISPPTGSPA